MGRGHLRLVSTVGLLTALLAFIGPTAAASAASGSVPSPVAGGWTLAGSAVVQGSASPPNLQLTDTSGGEAGLAYWPTAVPGAGITATFDALLDSGTGADGLTLMLADSSAGLPILGVPGGGLGFSGNKGLAVALDTYKNPVNPSNNFVGVATGAGPAPDQLSWGATATNVPALRGTPVHVAVTTTTTGLTVTIDGTQVISYTTAIPANVYVAFTGGDGGLTDRHAVQNVTITTGGGSSGPGVWSESPSPVPFGNVTVGQTGTQSFTITNTGGAALAVTAVTPPAAPFAASAPVTVGESIAPGQVLTQTVTFSPTATGPAAGSYSITVNDGLGAHVISLTGSGVTQSGGSVPSPVAGGWTLAGSAVVQGSASPPNLQLTDTSGGEAGLAYWPTAVPGAGITATFDALLDSGTGADGLTLMLADSSAGLPILGVPGGGLGFSGNKGLAVALDTYKNPVNPSNNFVGVATGAGPAPDQLSWGATATNVPALRGTPVHVAVTTTTTGLTVTIDGTQVISYTTAIPANVYVAFTGGDGGLTDRHAVQNVTITTGGGSSGPGVWSESPSPVPFGNVTVGQTGTQSFTITNTGGAALAVTAVTPPAAPFAASAPVTVGESIAPGQVLTQTVTFSPTATGPAAGSYSTTVNDGLGAHVISLTGSGVTQSGGSVPSPVAGGWTLAGSAVVQGSASPPNLQLTDTSGGEAGLAYWPTAVPGAGITATFDALLDSGTGADGLTLMLADSSAGLPILGVPGGGLGFSGNKGLAVALDTYKNPVNPSNNFVGVATGAGPAPDQLSWGATATNVPALRGTPVHVAVTTTTTGLTVTIDGTQVISYTTAIPANVYVAFTGGDGGLTDRHAVQNVTITTAPPTGPVSVNVLGMYLSNDSRTGVNAAEAGITPANAGSLTTKWTAPTGPASAQGNFLGNSSQPVIVNGVAYWGDWNGYEHATNITTGVDLWHANLGIDNDPADGCEPPEVGVSSTATVGTVGTRTEVFVGGGNASFYALDASTGAVIWQTSTGYQPAHFIWGSATIVNGNVYIGISSLGDCPLVQGGLAELDAGTGAIKKIFYTDQANGTGCPGADVTGSPAYDGADNSLYFTTGNSGTGTGCAQALGESIIKVDAGTLSLVDHWQVPAAESIYDGDYISTPTLFTGTIGGVATPLVGAVNKNGIFYAFARTSLSAGPVWQTSVALPGDCPECGGGGSSIVPAAFDGTNLYLGGGTVTIGATTFGGSAVALNPSTGAIVWQDGVNSPVLAAPTLSSGVLVYGEAGGKVHIVRTDTGAEVGSYSVTAPIYGSVGIANGVVYVPTGGGTLVALG